MEVQEIKRILQKYIEEIEYNPNRWDCVNFLIGYYGKVTAIHMTAILQMTRDGKILP